MPQSMDFNESHSAVENVVVITGKLISLPYGLKAGLNSESRYQQFYFLLLLLCIPPPAYLCLLFCFYLFLSTSYSLSPIQFSFIGSLLQVPSHTFKTLDEKPPMVLRSNCSARMGHDIALPCADPLAKKESQGCSDHLWIDRVTASLKRDYMIEG